MSEAEMTSRCPTSSASAPAQPLDDDDLLSEILLRLPSQPSSLPRASLVCSRWRLIVSDPGFLRRFRAHHRKPPLLGFFKFGLRLVDPTFTPTLDPPDRIPPRVSPGGSPGSGGGGHDDRYSMFGCRHGLVLLFNWILHRLMVWDPVTGDRRAVDIPGSFHDGHGRSLVVFHQGTVRCVDGGPFEVAILGTDPLQTRVFTCVYSSKTGNWGNVISTAFYSAGYIYHSSTLVGNSVYWLFQGDDISILQFDLDTQGLARIDVPPDVHAHVVTYYQIRIVPAEDGGLVLLVLPEFGLNVWKYKANCDGVAGWVLEKTIELDRLLFVEPGRHRAVPAILGFVEDHDEVFLRTDIGAFMVNLHSVQFKKLSQTMELGFYHPFTSFYTKNCCPIDG